MKKLLLLTLFASAASISRGQILDDYNANSLATGSISSWAPVTGSDVATTSNFTGTFLIPPYGAGLSDPTVANTDPIFNGNSYVSFGQYAGLATTGSIISGSSDRTLVAVYATTSAATTTAPIAGVGNNTSTVGSFFDLQSRNNVVTGDPYLAGFGADLSNGQAPAAERLTFALATYDGTTETLYWAYGTTGALNSVSAAATLNTSGQFVFGFDPADEPSPGILELGAVQVYGSSMDAAQAAAAITSLQKEYAAAPEPGTWALMFGGLGTLLVVLRLRRKQTL